MKSKRLNDKQFLALLEKVLPKTAKDPHLVTMIYEEVAKEVRLINSLESFEKFCAKGSVPDVNPETLDGLKSQLGGSFGDDNVVLTVEEDQQAVAVEITLPDRSISSKIKVAPPGTEDDGDAEAPFVPFPVALPEDKELVWVLARRENLGPDEAARALSNIEDEFWASKKGQKMQREGVEKSFAEFISNAPAAALKESGIKRYHKDPETVKALRLLSGEAESRKLEEVVL
jgi:hypothetical protein